MFELYSEIARIIGLVVPMYAANSIAMLLGGGKPLDFNLKFFDNRPVFGEGKTIRGFIAGIAAGIFFGFLFNIFYKLPNYMMFAIASSVGAVVGDVVGSFIKRRLGFERGTPVLFLDQLDFVFGALVFGYYFMAPTTTELIIIIIATLIAHKIGNIIAYLCRIKKVPW